MGKDESAAAAFICNGFRAVGSDRVLSFVVDSVSIYWSISYLLRVLMLLRELESFPPDLHGGDSLVCFC